VHTLQPHFHDAIGKRRKYDVRLFDMATRQWRKVRTQGHAQTDTGQAAAPWVVLPR
jgi:hypothetical protein